MGLDFGSREIVLHVKLPFDQLDSVFKTLGTPPGYDRPRPGPGVVLLPSKIRHSTGLPEHPVDAALALLERVAREGLMPLSQSLVERVGDLAELYGAIEKAEEA